MNECVARFPQSEASAVSGTASEQSQDSIEPDSYGEIPGQLTSFPVGTRRELLSLTYPIMMSLLSGGCAILANRIFLARYSIDAFFAVAEAVMFFIAFEFTLGTIASVLEMFVGQAYGAKEYKTVGRVVWTTIWISIGSLVVFWPLAWYGTEWLFAGSPNRTLASHYFSTLCFFGPLFPLNATLSAFWIGRGKTYFVTCVVAAVSLFNILIDPFLIFGIFPCSELGVYGASLARGISQFALTIILLFAFLSKQNRSRYATGQVTFDTQYLKKFFQYGAAQGLSMFVQSSAWAFFFRMMTLTSQVHELACGISDTIYFFLTFVIEGISKATSSVVSNLTGSKRFCDIRHVLSSAMRLLAVFGCILAVCLCAFPDKILKVFLPEDRNFITPETWSQLRSCLVWTWVTVIGEAFLYLSGGILMVLGHTRFTLLITTIFVWMLGVFPAYMTTSVWPQPAHIVLGIACTYYLATGLGITLRTKRCLRQYL